MCKYSFAAFSPQLTFLGCEEKGRPTIFICFICVRPPFLEKHREDALVAR